MNKLFSSLGYEPSSYPYAIPGGWTVGIYDLWLYDLEIKQGYILS